MPYAVRWSPVTSSAVRRVASGVSGAVVGSPRTGTAAWRAPLSMVAIDETTVYSVGRSVSAGTTSSPSSSVASPLTFTSTGRVAAGRNHPSRSWRATCCRRRVTGTVVSIVSSWAMVPPMR